MVKEEGEEYDHVKLTLCVHTSLAYDSPRVVPFIPLVVEPLEPLSFLVQLSLQLSGLLPAQIVAVLVVELRDALVQQANAVVVGGEQGGQVRFLAVDGFDRGIVFLDRQGARGGTIERPYIDAIKKSSSVP
jgi:hypothetical protein